MFESGNLPDLHQVKKTKIDEPPPESGVYENVPETLEGVIRSSDLNMEGEELKKGSTKKIHDDLMAKVESGSEPKERKPINVAEDEGRILENEPSVREGVARETDGDPSDAIVLQKGHAANLKKQLLSKQDAPKERKTIKLVEDDQAQTVYESQPERREGVVRADDETDLTKFERGKAKNLKGFWSTRTDDVEVKREKIVIDKNAGPTVLESQPEVLEGVIRSSDVPDSEKAISIESGRSRNIASNWGRKSEEGQVGRKQPIKLDLANSGPTVLENNPVELEGVVRSDTVVEDVIPGNRGRTSDLANKFLQQEDSDADKKPRKQIEIERSAGPVVLENEPAAPAVGVVRSDSMMENVNLDTGRTRNLVGSWRDKEKEVLETKTSSSKPHWLKEIEAAKESTGVYENQPDINPDCVKESDIPDCEKQQLIPDNYARSMRNIWKQKEEDELNPKVKDGSELVRFTPPRELTPPPIKQQGSFQSTQTLKLGAGSKPSAAAPSQNGSVDAYQQQQLQQQQMQYQQQQQQMQYQQQQQQQLQYQQQQQQLQYQQQQQQQMQYQQQQQQLQYQQQMQNGGYQNGSSQEAVEPESQAPPAQTVKSSTMLVLK